MRRPEGRVGRSAGPDPAGPPAASPERSVGRPPPTAQFPRRQARTGSVGRPDPGRNRARADGRLGRSGTISIKSTSLRHTSVRARHVSFESCDGQNGTVACDQSSRAPSSTTDTWQVRWSSAAMMKTLPDEADMMPGLGPVPLLQRQSASESRWTRTVPTSREAAFQNGRFWSSPK